MPDRSRTNMTRHTCACVATSACACVIALYIVVGMSVKENGSSRLPTLVLASAILAFFVCFFLGYLACLFSIRMWPRPMPLPQDVLSMPLMLEQEELSNWREEDPDQVRDAVRDAIRGSVL